VKVKLLPKTREILKQFVQEKDLKGKDFLFVNRYGKRLSTDWYRKLVKKWAFSIGLDPKEYSGHSTRRTKAIFLYETYRDLEVVRIALGHKSLAATIAYLGVEEKRVMDHLLECEM
jgi:site-specific recombinase XerD